MRDSTQIRYVESLESLPRVEHDLNERQCDEVVQALDNTSVGDGHLTSAMDPVLCAFCAAFRVSIVHDWYGVAEKFLFEIAAPRRVVHLASSIGHMEHQANYAPDDRKLSRGLVAHGGRLDRSVCPVRSE